jgi:hypothetical protein
LPSLPLGKFLNFVIEPFRILPYLLVFKKDRSTILPKPEQPLISDVSPRQSERSSLTPGKMEEEKKAQTFHEKRI